MHAAGVPSGIASNDFSVKTKWRKTYKKYV